MAHLSVGGGREDERGQLLLIAAFIIAVSFVVLALVVNSAIFTENLATRDDVAGSGEALDFRYEVEQNVGGVITAINRNNSILEDHPTPDLEDRVETNVDRLANNSGIQQSTQGRIVQMAFIEIEQGVKVAQDADREFTNRTGDAWNGPLIEGAENTRKFQINVTEQPTTLLGSSFEVTVEETSGSDSWSMEVAGNTVGSDVDIEVEHGSESETCTAEFDGSLTIDVTEGTVGGEPCHALTRQSDGTPMWFATNIDGSYDISFEQGDELNGTYSFIVDQGSPADSDDFGSVGADKPYIKDPAVYSANVSYSYYTPDIGYETVIRAAPGEVPS